MPRPPLQPGPEGVVTGTGGHGLLEEEESHRDDDFEEWRTAARWRQPKGLIHREGAGRAAYSATLAARWREKTNAGGRKHMASDVSAYTRREGRREEE